MILDEPDEDADSLDDNGLLEAFLDTEGAANPPDAAAAVRDWPPRGSTRDILFVDGEILAWFKANHEDWQKQIRSVLRAWIATRPNGHVRNRNPGT